MFHVKHLYVLVALRLQVLALLQRILSDVSFVSRAFLRVKPVFAAQKSPTCDDGVNGRRYGVAANWGNSSFSKPEASKGADGRSNHLSNGSTSGIFVRWRLNSRAAARQPVDPSEDEAARVLRTRRRFAQALRRSGEAVSHPPQCHHVVPLPRSRPRGIACCTCSRSRDAASRLRVPPLASLRRAFSTVRRDCDYS